MTHNNPTRPTWHDALAIAKELQEEYQIPIFAMTYRGGACRCCPSVAQFNEEAYLTKFTERLNAKAEATYKLTMPKDKDTCALIEEV